MELFNIGILEFLFIILLALVILGPKKSVKIASDIGRWVRKFLNSPIWKDITQTSKDLRDIPQKIMDDAEIEHTLEDIDRSVYNTKDSEIERDADIQQGISNKGKEEEN